MRLIAVIDDERLICDFVADALCDLPAEVHCAVTGYAGAALLRSRGFDLALIDVILPDVSGLSLARAAANENTPSIMVSGHPGAAMKCHEFGFHFVSKPFGVADLTKEAAQVLADNRAALRRVREAAAKMLAKAKPGR